ncbi:MAG: acetyl-CoA C-acyltransferase, partial [Elusimicrobiota bacterium]
MADHPEVLILAGARTPFAEWSGGKTGAGRPGGALKTLSALALGSIALKGALERSKVEPKDLDHVVFGNALQTSADAIYGARHVSLGAGVPQEVPALSVARICGTGIQSVVTGAQLIQLGEAKLVGAGGTENLSQAPHIVRGLRGGPKLKHMEFEDYFLAGLYDPIAGLMMAQTAEVVSKKYGISRKEQDLYALRSCKEAVRAQKEGLFKEEIVPVVLEGRKPRTISEDDHCVPDSTEEKLAALRPVFSKDGFVTAGNASGVVDGAGAVVLSDAATAKSKGLPVLGKIRAWASTGVDPREMGMGPVSAVSGALKKAGLKMDDVDIIEINEAFAGQYLAVEKELGNPREKTNVNGGAIAIG